MTTTALGDDVQNTISKSAEYFVAHVWPALRDHVGGGEILPVETVVGSKMCRVLDTQSGVDAWQFKEGSGLRAIASRVQFDDHAVDRHGDPWNSFTVRAKTARGNRSELDKRLDAIENGWLYPHYTVQAYTVGGALLSCAIAKTKDVIYAAIMATEKANGSDGALFRAVYWDDLAKMGAWLRAAGELAPVLDVAQ